MIRLAAVQDHETAGIGRGEDLAIGTDRQLAHVLQLLGLADVLLRRQKLVLQTADFFTAGLHLDLVLLFGLAHLILEGPDLVGKLAVPGRGALPQGLVGRVLLRDRGVLLRDRVFPLGLLCVEPLLLLLDESHVPADVVQHPSHRAFHVRVEDFESRLGGKSGRIYVPYFDVVPIFADNAAVPVLGVDTLREGPLVPVLQLIDLRQDEVLDRQEVGTVLGRDNLPITIDGDPFLHREPDLREQLQGQVLAEFAGPHGLLIELSHEGALVLHELLGLVRLDPSPDHGHDEEHDHDDEGNV